ncbi:ABC transporter ATP-binding protein [Methylophaga thiooxydans]|uniref:ABC transporter, ATP-binding protein, putative n=1 Tax=Methylophaga thiooxydans DMS010 TaxID=637616 RepID=C0N907_9GAMM|nr:ABC transporter ATP-binding protein [Methylophaga thiooxydans]EEF78670.1 ABC transporter, ATP-binding protein, putative [Methylophaga thiooxydans DMS010]
MFVINDLKFHYPDDDNDLLNIPHWQVAAGESVFLSAPSGTGKSTLVNLLAGIITPQHGTIRVMDSVINHLSSRQRDAFRARHIGMVFQQFNLIPYLSVMDNIRLASRFSDMSRAEADERSHTLLQMLGLTTLDATRQAEQLSVGQQQRVAIVRALVNEPALLLVDEPTSALDAAHRDQFIGLLMQQLDTSRTSLVFVSHDSSLKHHFSRHVHIGQLQHDAD